MECQETTKWGPQKIARFIAPRSTWFMKFIWIYNILELSWWSLSYNWGVPHYRGCSENMLSPYPMDNSSSFSPLRLSYSRYTSCFPIRTDFSCFPSPKGDLRGQLSHPGTMKGVPVLFSAFVNSDCDCSRTRVGSGDWSSRQLVAAAETMRGQIHRKATAFFEFIYRIRFG